MDKSEALPTSTARLSNAIPFFIAVLASGILLLILVTGVVQKTGGLYSYPLDDTYIHMQIGKNLAFHGTWGIKPGEFESASSSLFYPLLLAAVFRIFGVHTAIPLVLNIIAGIILLFVANKWLLRQSVALVARTGILLLAVFLMPLPVMISTGMEHCFQTLTVFLFLTTVSGFLGRPVQKKPARLPFDIRILALLVTGFRYEGIFLIAAVALVMLWKKNYRNTVAIMVAGSMPVIAFGLYSMSKGSYFLPNSVILKSFLPVSLHEISAFARLLFNHFILGPMDDFPGQMSFLAAERLLIALPLLYLLSSYKNTTGSANRFFILILFFTTLLHLGFASTGWFFRYEAYLVFCAALIIPTALYQTAPVWMSGKRPVSKLFAALLLTFLAAPAFFRAGEALLKNKISCINIFEQQYQSARFIKEFYDHSVVAVNDIGAVSFFTDAELVDLVGLGNIEVARHWKDNTFSADYLNGLMKEKNVRFAIVPQHFRDDFFSRWVLVASLEISNNFSCGRPLVNIYVPEITGKAVMQSNLRSFQADAPPTIAFRYY